MLPTRPSHLPPNPSPQPARIFNTALVSAVTIPPQRRLSPPPRQIAAKTGIVNGAEAEGLWRRAVISHSNGQGQGNGHSGDGEREKREGEKSSSRKGGERARRLSTASYSSSGSEAPARPKARTDLSSKEKQRDIRRDEPEPGRERERAREIEEKRDRSDRYREKSFEAGQYESRSSNGGTHGMDSSRDHISATETPSSSSRRKSFGSKSHDDRDYERREPDRYHRMQRDRDALDYGPIDSAAEYQPRRKIDRSHPSKNRDRSRSNGRAGFERDEGTGASGSGRKVSGNSNGHRNDSERDGVREKWDDGAERERRAARQRETGDGYRLEKETDDRRGASIKDGDDYRSDKDRLGTTERETLRRERAPRDRSTDRRGYDTYIAGSRTRSPPPADYYSRPRYGSRHEDRGGGSSSYHDRDYRGGGGDRDRERYRDWDRERDWNRERGYEGSSKRDDRGEDRRPRQYDRGGPSGSHHSSREVYAPRQSSPPRTNMASTPDEAGETREIGGFDSRRNLPPHLAAIDREKVSQETPEPQAEANMDVDNPPGLALHANEEEGEVVADDVAASAAPIKVAREALKRDQPDHPDQDEGQPNNKRPRPLPQRNDPYSKEAEDYQGTFVVVKSIDPASHGEVSPPPFSPAIPSGARSTFRGRSSSRGNRLSEYSESPLPPPVGAPPAPPTSSPPPLPPSLSASPAPRMLRSPSAKKPALTDSLATPPSAAASPVVASRYLAVPTVARAPSSSSPLSSMALDSPVTARLQMPTPVEPVARAVTPNANLEHEPPSGANTPYSTALPVMKRIKGKGGKLDTKREKRDYARKFVGIARLADFDHPADDAEATLGKGTFGLVTKATRRRDQRLVALKKMQVPTEEGKAPHRGVLGTTLREIKILKILDHENIVPLLDIVVDYDAVSQKKETFLVFPYMDHDLCGLLRNKSLVLTQSLIKLYMLQLLEGLAYMHRNNLIHRDLKTANLLINNQGLLQIADFGLARAIHASSSEDAHDARYTNMVVTRWYRAPELFMGETCYGPEVDMWSVGCILGEMIHKHVIIQGASDVKQLQMIFELCGSPPQDWDRYKTVLSRREVINDSKGDDPRHSIPVMEVVGKTLQTRRLQNDPRFREMPSACTHLLERLMEINPAKRLTALQAINDQWFWRDPLPSLRSDVQELAPSKERRDVQEADEAEYKARQQRQNVAAFAQASAAAGPYGIAPAYQAPNQPPYAGVGVAGPYGGGAAMVNNVHVGPSAGYPRPTPPRPQPQVNNYIHNNNMHQYHRPPHAGLSSYRPQTPRTGPGPTGMMLVGNNPQTRTPTLPGPPKGVVFGGNQARPGIGGGPFRPTTPVGTGYRTHGNAPYNR